MRRTSKVTQTKYSHLYGKTTIEVAICDLDNFNPCNSTNLELSWEEPDGHECDTIKRWGGALYIVSRDAQWLAVDRRNDTKMFVYNCPWCGEKLRSEEQEEHE